MDITIYWLKPRADCFECGFSTCLEFVNAVNNGRASVEDCPYVYCEESDLENNQKTTDSDNNNMIEPIVKTVGKPNKTESTLNLRFDGKKIADIKVTKKTTVYKKPERILNSIADENLTPKEKEAFFKKELQKSKRFDQRRNNIQRLGTHATKHYRHLCDVHKTPDVT